ncbi:MAG: phosphatidylglycerophosphatase A [Elusimicrobia bacterium]|nr:phosphatidylglycerophosphatase A [Elusimicrobiota bacterium]
MNFLILFLSTGFGLGNLAYRTIRRFKFFPISDKWSGGGFLGTLLGLGLVMIGFSFPGWREVGLLFLFTLAVIGITGKAEELLGQKDDPRIVLDEVVGVLWSLIFLPVHAWNDSKRIVVLAAALVLFRIFDVCKVPFRSVQNLQGGIGIVLDDVLAGLCANLILQACIRFF